MDFLNFIFQERIGIDGEVCPFISIANDTTIERIMETLNVDIVTIGHLGHVL